MKYIYMPDGIEPFKNQAHTSRREQFARLLEQCALYQKEALPAEHPMKSITYFGMAAANLALAYKLTGDARYLTEARRWLSQGVAYEHWGRAVHVDVDLSAAWLLFGFGLAYNWIGADLPEDERKALLEKLKLQGGRMYDYSVEAMGRSWPSEYWQNHNWIDYAGLAAAGYAIAGEHPPAKAWTDRARENFQTVYPLLADDGSDYEGVVYWRYGVIWLLLYAIALRDMEGVDLLKESAFIKNTFYYRLYQCAPALDTNFNYGDCHDRRSGHSIAFYYKIASEYGNPHAQWLAEKVRKEFLFREGHESGVRPGILPEAFLEYLWYDPSIEPQDVSGLPLTRFFPDLGLLSVRSSWQSDALAMSIKCSSGGGHKQWAIGHEMERAADPGYKILGLGHHHPDASAFQIINGRDYLAVDEGYCRDKRAENHSLIIVDGKGYHNEGGYDPHGNLDAGDTADVTRFEQHGDMSYICCESQKLYDKALELTLNRREMLSAGGGVFVIRDRLESAREHKYTFLLQCESAPVKTGDNRRTVFSGHSRMDIHSFGEALEYGVKTTSIAANPTTQEPALMVYSHMQTFSAECSERRREYELITVIYAGYVTEPAPDVALDGKTIIISSDESVRRVTFDAGSILTVTSGGETLWKLD